MKIGVTGHQNIPLVAVNHIEMMVTSILRKYADHELIGISSLAIGADQLFAKLVLQNGGKLSIVIPCENYEETFKNADDLSQYYSLREKASEVLVLNFPSPSQTAFLEAGKLLAEMSEILIAIWDGKKANGIGGTADIVHYASACKKRVKIIWPGNLNR
jgi:hypothetical protein